VGGSLLDPAHFAHGHGSPLLVSAPTVCGCTLLDLDRCRNSATGEDNSMAGVTRTLYLAS